MSKLWNEELVSALPGLHTGKESRCETFQLSLNSALVPVGRGEVGTWDAFLTGPHRRALRMWAEKCIILQVLLSCRPSFCVHS